MATISFLGTEGLRELIAKCKTVGWKTEVVDALPETGEDRILYLLKDASATGTNLFDEYIWNEGEWEMLGSATLEIDLQNYAKKTDVESLQELVDSLQETVLGLEAAEVTNVAASGSGELTLESSKSGTVVTITGSVDLSEYVKNADLTEITAAEVDAMWDAD